MVHVVRPVWEKAGEANQVFWEWLHKSAALTEGAFSPELFTRLLDEEYAKLQRAGNRDVHDNSKQTTLPIAREIVKTCVEHHTKLPWFIDLLNLNLGNHDLADAGRRIQTFVAEFESHGRRVTSNIDFE